MRINPTWSRRLVQLAAGQFPRWRAKMGIYKMYTIAGEKVTDAVFNGSSASLSTNRLAPGIYFVRTAVAYRDGSTRTWVQKVAVIK